MLLSDKDTASYIKDNFVAAWKMVRPVPQVTIDFGNGKVMKRTLAGNTVLYVSLPDGTVVDAFPGVYTPSGFRKVAAPALEAANAALKLPTAKRPAFLAGWHRSEADRLAKIELQMSTMSKAMVERPLLNALGMAGADPAPGPKRSPFEVYAAKVYDVSKRPGTTKEVLRSYGIPEDADPRVTAERIIAADSDVNVNRVHPGVHLLLMARGRETADSLQDTIFKRLLHVDIDDPYLGLRDVPMPGTPDK